MPRPQFLLSTLLWLTLAAACWFGGMRFERWLVHRAVEWDERMNEMAPDDEIDNPFADFLPDETPVNMRRSSLDALKRESTPKD
jgi:hypothetical protein